jgi:hypothetical protein
MANRMLKAITKKEKLIFQLMQPLPALIGVFISIIGLVFYSYLQVGDKYIELSASFYLVEPTVVNGISLFFEGIVSAVIVTYTQCYWKSVILLTSGKQKSAVLFLFMKFRKES